MITGFRYNSSWEQFEKSVKILKKLISQNKAYWMIGCIRDLDIYIDEKEEETLQDDILNIFHEEILYLLYSLLEGEKIEEDDIREAATGMDDEISEEELQKMVTSIHNKLELVKDAFDIDNLTMRKNLKKESVNAKLSDFGYNIYITKLLNGEKVECAIINLTSQKKLRSIKGNPINIFLQKEENDVSFICDREDLDLMIHKLKTIRRKMEEY